MNSNEVRRSITRIFKNDRRIQVYTRVVKLAEKFCQKWRIS